MVSEKFFCKKCKYSGSEIPNENGCQSLFNTHGWDNVECLDFDKEEIVDEINGLDIKNNVGTPINVKSGNLELVGGKLELHGESGLVDGKESAMKYPLKKECSGTDCKWLFYDINKDGGAGWIDLMEWFTTSKQTEQNENVNEQIKDTKSLSDKIEEKLRDIYFYTVTEKGKERIVFDLEDKKNIEHELRDLSNQNVMGDKAFVMAVVRSKGMDKNDDLIVKLGSYPKDSNVDLGFSERGLGSLIGTQYFSIKNNVGPDDRDFDIVKGDIYDESEFKSEPEVEDKSETEMEVQQPVKEEPYEEVMKQKERKGLQSLVDTNEVSNEFTKKQKELLEKLKKGGYLFKRPVDESGYDVKNVKSSEFTESFKVWKKKS